MFEQIESESYIKLLEWNRNCWREEAERYERWYKECVRAITYCEIAHGETRENAVKMACAACEPFKRTAEACRLYAS